MTDGGEKIPSGEEFRPDFSLLGSIKQRLIGMHRADNQAALTFLKLAADNQSLKSDEIRLFKRLSEKILSWNKFDDVLRKQGPLSDDDILQFNLSDQEIDELMSFVRRRAAPDDQIGRVEEGYRAGLQNPLAAQLTQFFRSSKRIFRVPKDRMDEFSSDRFGDMKWKDIILPHRSFAVEFATPIEASDTKSGRNLMLTGMIVSQLHDIDPSYGENTIQIRAMVANTAELQEMAANDTGAADRKKTMRMAERAFLARIQERLTGKLKDTTAQKVEHWKRELDTVLKFERMLNENTGATIEVDVDDTIDKSGDESTDAQFLRILAGTCLYVANSGKLRSADGESQQSAPGAVEVTTLQGRDKEYEIKLTPQQMLEGAIKLQSNRGELLDPHKRRKHERTYHRGTPHEFTGKVKEAMVVGKRKVLPKAFSFGVTTTVVKSGI